MDLRSPERRKVSPTAKLRLSSRLQRAMVDSVSPFFKEYLKAHRHNGKSKQNIWEISSYWKLAIKREWKLKQQRTDTESCARKRPQVKSHPRRAAAGKRPRAPEPLQDGRLSIPDRKSSGISKRANSSNWGERLQEAKTDAAYRLNQATLKFKNRKTKRCCHPPK